MDTYRLIVVNSVAEPMTIFEADDDEQNVIVYLYLYLFGIERLRLRCLLQNSNTTRTNG